MTELIKGILISLAIILYLFIIIVIVLWCIKAGKRGEYTPKTRSLYINRKGYYIDARGYYRYANSGRLVHRQIAYKYVYLPNKDNYVYNFGSYVIHHKNRHKLDNNSSNLEILTREEHEKRHGIIPRYNNI